VYWSPPFVGNIRTDANEEWYKSFIEASKSFSDIINSPDMAVEEKMDSGTCVIFNNLRIVHARNAFDLNSGRRWLRGSYLAEQDFISKAASLRHKWPADSLRDAYPRPPWDMSDSRIRTRYEIIDKFPNARTAEAGTTNGDVKARPSNVRRPGKRTVELPSQQRPEKTPRTSASQADSDTDTRIVIEQSAQ
jgi:hypothetical protein